MGVLSKKAKLESMTILTNNNQFGEYNTDYVLRKNDRVS